MYFGFGCSWILLSDEEDELSARNESCGLLFDRDRRLLFRDKRAFCSSFSAEEPFPSVIESARSFHWSRSRAPFGVLLLLLELPRLSCRRRRLSLPSGSSGFLAVTVVVMPGLVSSDYGDALWETIGETVMLVCLSSAIRVSALAFLLAQSLDWVLRCSHSHLCSVTDNRKERLFPSADLHKLSPGS